MFSDKEKQKQLRELRLENIASENDDLDIDTAPYKITTYGADMTLEILAQKVKEKEITIPEFQRRYVWPHKKSSKLIESFLLGLPVPQIFLYRENVSQTLLVVDGQQRLRSIAYFFDERFENGDKFFLQGVRPAWEGKTYLGLNESDKRRFKNYILRATIFEQTDPKDDTSIYEIFNRLNTGGMALNEQEIRNCVIHGEINPFLKDLNQNDSWRKLLGKSSPDPRMKDIEMILRFLALREKWKDYKKPMKDFISDFMRRHKNLDERTKSNFAELFSSVISKIYNDIGTEAYKRKGGINVAMFDSLTVGLSIVGPEKIEHLKDKYEILKTNDAYEEAISSSTTDVERVQSRIKLVIQTFSG